MGRVLVVVVVMVVDGAARNHARVHQVAGLEVTPFPVLHGEDYVSLGFLFGPEGNKICYISDVRCEANGNALGFGIPRLQHVLLLLIDTLGVGRIPASVQLCFGLMFVRSRLAALRLFPLHFVALAVFSLMNRGSKSLSRTLSSITRPAR